MIDPENVLALSVPPLPEKSFDEEVPTLSLASSEAYDLNTLYLRVVSLLIPLHFGLLMTAGA